MEHNRRVRLKQREIPIRGKNGDFFIRRDGAEEKVGIRSLDALGVV